MNWTDTLTFARGPMFYAALLVFVGGMLYRLASIAGLRWGRDRVPARGSKAGGVARSFLKGLLIWPFIPWVKQTFTRNPVIYLAGGLFHLGLFAVIFLGTAHMLVWKSLLGFGWPTLPLPIVDWLAAGAIAAMIALLIHRLVNPVMRLISGPAEYLSWLMVFLPMVSGYILTHHVWFPYELAFTLHMWSINLMLVWIPLSRISHFMFYFFARAIHGQEFGKRGVQV
jgi:nitrate reductase gamma subunit